jgi:hypothetical protein
VGERFCGGDRSGRALSVAGEGRAHVEAAGRGGAGGPLLGPLAVGGGTQGAAQARGGTLLGGGGPAGAGDRVAVGRRCAVGGDGGATGVEDRLGGGGGFASLAGPLGAAKEDDVSLEDGVSVVPVGSVKGLEFDGVVVVEPGQIADESPQGLRALYVSLTRATKRLTIVHAEPLPAVLGLG